MSILLPVNPPFSGWLVDGLKTVEWRKKPLPEGKAYIYDTKKNGGCGMVIGKVCIIRSTKEDVGDLFGKMYDQFSTVPDIVNFLKEGKISKEDLVKYGNGKAVYACECVEAIRYSNPIPLTEFRYRCPDPKNCWMCKYSMVDEIYSGRFDLGCHAGIDHPPQSWCYCEDLKGESE